MKPAVTLSDRRFPETTWQNNFRSFSVFAINRLLVFAALLSCRVTFSAGQSLKSGLSEKITAYTGETVILPCNISVSDELPTVEWSKAGLDPNITFLYRDGCETFDMKNNVFQYRTNLIMDQLSNGNISLMISNAQLTDAGKYQCVVVWMKNRRVKKTLELVVGAASEPKLSVVPGLDGGVTLQCEAKCWFPAPEVTFHDDQGNSISAENPKRDQDPSGCFTVTRRVIVHTPNSSVTCRVHEPEMNKTWESEIYIPADCMRSCIVTAIIAVVAVILPLVVLCACVFYFLRKKHVGKQSSGQRNTSVCQGNQAGDNQSPTAELQRKIKELENKLRDKDRRIHQLTEDLRSRQVPVLQHSQPTINSGPSTSSPDVSKSINQAPHQFLHDNINKPPASANSNHPKSGNVPKKAAKPGGSRQNPALGPATGMRSHSNSSPALFINNEALSSSFSSSSTSEEKCLVRTKSVTYPCSNITRSPRRYTVSNLSHNRFSVLGNLPEESEMLLSQK